MAHQLVTRIDDDLAAALDELVETGAVRSRSAAVRLGLERLIDAERRRRIGEEIVEAYRRIPQTDDEVDGLWASTVAMIAEEPW